MARAERVIRLVDGRISDRVPTGEQALVQAEASAEAPA